MILSAFIIRPDGATMLARSYRPNGAACSSDPLPPLVKATVTLFHSRSSTRLEKAYTLMQGDLQWVYMFFKRFAIVFLTRGDGAVPVIAKKMLAIGKELARDYGHILPSWDGDLSALTDVARMVDSIVMMDTDWVTDDVVRAAEEVVDHALEYGEVSYVGVFDMHGRMLQGNVPESHLLRIRAAIDQLVPSGATGVVPVELGIGEFRAYLLRVRWLTVVIATHRSARRVRVMSVAGELAQMLDRAVAQLVDN